MISEIDQELAKDFASFAADPLACAKYAFPWGEGDLKGESGPREWQAKLMREIGEHLQDPKTRFTPFLYAVSSGHGIGKSALIGMIQHWAMSTCVDTKIVTTANTDTQLRTKTAPEVGKWFRKAINAHWFKVTATAIYSAEEEHEKNWRSDFVPWSANNTEAFAGLHNKGKRIVLVFDEASAIDDRVWDVAEGALTDEDTEIIWLVFGNPTRNVGRFRECFRRYRDRWRHAQIDSRTVPGTNKEVLDAWVKSYGEDSDFVKIRVRGMFPAASAKQFISSVDVDRAFAKELKPEQYSWAPKILTLDNAWEGDDEGVIGLRQGLSFKILKVFVKNDNDVEVAQDLARFEDEHKADAVFIDGGYGTGVLSVGKTLGRNWLLVWFSAASSDRGCLNKRAEMWKLMRDWLKEGGSIPADQSLYTDLISPETVARLDGKIQLESKKDMKGRGLPSPGRADALALSFAYPVQAKNLETADPEIYHGVESGWMG